jgi:tRNA pseudouridine38-40 synthase
MNRAARALVGRHDFHSFETNWPNRTSSVRTITHLAVSRMGDFVWVDVEADGFLYNMVRAITGTLVLVGNGRKPESWVADALAAEDRAEAGPTAPPQGLFLVRVRYS